MFSATVLCSSSDSMKLSQTLFPRKKLFSRIQLSGLRYEITLRLIHIVTLNCCSIANKISSLISFFFSFADKWEENLFVLYSMERCIIWFAARFNMFQQVLIYFRRFYRSCKNEKRMGTEILLSISKNKKKGILVYLIPSKCIFCDVCHCVV